MLTPSLDRGGGPDEERSLDRTRPPWIDRPEASGVLVAHGALDFGFAAELRAALDAALADRPARIELDLADVWLLDATSLRVLLVFRRQAAAAGCVFRVVGAGGLVRRVLAVTDTLSLLD
jgi:anti-anti-sigma factor